MAREYIKRVEVVSMTPTSPDLYLTEGFEDAFAWEIGGYGTPNGYKTPALPAEGLYCAAVKTSAGVVDFAHISKRLGQIPSKYIEIGAMVKNYYPAEDVSIEILLRWIRGTDEWQYRITYRSDNQKWYFTNSAGNKIEMTSLTKRMPSGAWCKIRFIVDVTKNKYVAAYFGLEKADLSNESGYIMYTGVLESLAEIALIVQNSSAQSRTIYFDQIIVRAVDSIE